jgi:hypothetical protein
VKKNGPASPAWSDDRDCRWSEAAATTLSVRVVPTGDEATEIVLEGRCPRCLHQTVSTHPIRTIISDSAAKERAAKDGVAPHEAYAIRRVAAECCCLHEHPDTPEGRRGCGVPFALWVSWSTQTCTRSRLRRLRRRLLGKPTGATREVEPLKSAGEPSALDVEEERELRTSAATQLADVRKAAESWRTGLAGFLAILVAVFFIKGKDSFDDISGTSWKTTLAVLLLVSAALALFGAYRALRAAYGTPRDEYLGEVSPLFRRLPSTTPRYIYDYGTVSAWHHAASRTAVHDLRLAKGATIGSLLAFAAAASVTWFAPGPPAAFIKAAYRTPETTATLCGKSVASPVGTLTIKPSEGQAQRIQLAEVVSIKAVESCK